MPAALKRIRQLEGERVRLHFDDGREEHAILLCATKDMDGSGHIVYEPIPPDGGPDSGPDSAANRASNEPTGMPEPCLYAKADTLLSIEHDPLPLVA